MLLIKKENCKKFALAVLFVALLLRLFACFFTGQTFSIFGENLINQTVYAYALSSVGLVTGFLFYIPLKSAKGFVCLAKPKTSYVLIGSCFLIALVGIACVQFGGVPLFENVISGTSLSELRDRPLYPGLLGVVNLINFLLFHLLVVRMKFHCSKVYKAFIVIMIFVCFFSATFRGGRQGLVLMVLIYILYNYVLGSKSIFSFRNTLLFFGVFVFFVTLGLLRVGYDLTFENFFFPISFYIGLPTVNANFCISLNSLYHVSPVYFFLEYVPSFFGSLPESLLPPRRIITSPLGLVGSSYFYGGSILVFISSFMHGFLLRLTSIKACVNRFCFVAFPYVSWAVIATFSHSGIFVHNLFIMPVLFISIFIFITRTSVRGTRYVQRIND